MDESGQANKQMGFVRRAATTAWEGILGNAAWGLLVIVGVAGATLRNVSAPLWVFAIGIGIATGLVALVVSRARHVTARLEGERDEAQRHAANAVARVQEVEEAAERAQRELRDQLAAASGGHAAVSTRMQAFVRQIQAVRAGTDSSFPDTAQRGLLLAVLEDLEAILDQDAVVSTVSQHVRNFDYTFDGWISLLEVLEARLLSIGIEEALGGTPDMSRRASP